MSEIVKIFANWKEGWRVFGRLVIFQVVYTVFLIPLTGLWKLLEQFFPNSIDPHHLSSATIAALALAIFGGGIYLPFALFSASQVTGYLKGKHPRYPWEDSPPSV
jgi:hypothetical protein